MISRANFRLINSLLAFDTDWHKILHNSFALCILHYVIKICIFLFISCFCCGPLEPWDFYVCIYKILLLLHNSLLYPCPSQLRKLEIFLFCIFHKSQYFFLKVWSNSLTYYSYLPLMNPEREIKIYSKTISNLSFHEFCNIFITQVLTNLQAQSHCSSFC